MTGGGKTMRDGMGFAAGVRRADGCLDMVVHNALVIDPVLGIVKGDIGIRDGKIVGVGKAGNPAIMAGVHPDLVCGASTVVCHGEGYIATPGGIDVHVHQKSVELTHHALSTGLTSMFGGGHGILMAIDSGGEWHTGRMLQAAEHFPLNFGFFSRGSLHVAESVAEGLAGGVIGVKIHEDYGAMPATIDACLRAADEHDFQVQLHTDTPQRGGLLRGHHRRGRGPHHPHVPHRGRGRRPRAGHHPLQRGGELPALVDQSHQSLHRQHLRRAPGHDDGRPPPEPGRSRRTWPSPRAAFAPRPSRRKTSSTTWERSRCSAPTARGWAGSTRSFPAAGSSRAR